ncbi:MAG: HAMP domain-containing histidine kinase [Planctomycetes bacterium]|nr:HAMP domain-containing histidine kinase [Planctomycetota bacterium]
MTRTTPQDPGSLAGSGLTLTERVLFGRLGWFVQVRWAAGAAALVFMALGWYVFHVRFAATPAVLVVCALFGYNAFFFVRARSIYRAGRVSRQWVRALAHAQIICDLLAVAALVHYIGGVENHFIVLFVFPMIVASEFFSTRIAYAYATVAAALINLIAWGEYFFFESAQYPLRVLVSHDPAAYDPLVAPGAAHHWVFVTQVCFVATFAAYITVFVASSISSRLRSREGELEEAYADLQSLELVKSQFMRKTSHELRAPVGAIQSLLKAALHQIPGDARGRDLIERGVDRSENMLDLIDDLLRYSRLKTAVTQERFEPVELAEIVRGSADLFRPRAEEKGIRLDVEAAAAPVVGIRDSLADLVNNLVSNAVRYTPDGGSVTVRVGAADGVVRLVVSDSGIGIPADELPRVFDEFFRGQAAKEVFAHGTGLGMSIVKRVVEMHNGRIGLTSQPGKGTEFAVTFPRSPEAPGEG